MRQDVKKWLAIGTLLGLGYLAYNYFTRKDYLLSLDFTRSLAQQIKHQMLIVSITFTDFSKESVQKIRSESSAHLNQLIGAYTEKMASVYEEKQKLILKKYQISKQRYQISLKKYSNDKLLQKIQGQMIQAMYRSVRGQLPDLTVDKKITNLFGKSQVQKLYVEASKMILNTIMVKLQNQQKQNPHIDITSDENFKTAIKNLNIYQKKKQFYKGKGFNQQWGCPNQNFLKLTQGFKHDDPQFKERLKILQKIFDNALNQITHGPFKYDAQKINKLFNEANLQIPKPLSKSVIQVHNINQQQPLFHINKSTKSQPEYNEELNKPNNECDISDQLFNDRHQ